VTRTVRVGVADSGVNARDVQVGSVEGGIGIRFRNGRVETDVSWEDVLGHGTAVAATIRGHAPEARLYSVRIFHRRLEAHVEALVRAIDWAAEEKLDLLNLSLGCTSLEPGRDFAEACERAARAGVVIVTAAESDGHSSLPGALAGVIAVAADASLEESEIRYDGTLFRASPWARKRGELPRERNFHGTSFAVANVTGLAAHILGETGHGRSLVEELVLRAAP
jgi:subtilisin family serine protease